MKWLRQLVYCIAIPVIQALRLLFKVEFQNRRLVPKRGPLVILYNHQSNWDPLMLGWAADRRLNYLAKKELFNPKKITTRLLGYLIRVYGAFPLDRKNPLATKSSFKYIRELLKDGEGLAIAPEGTRNKRFKETNRLLPLKAGIVRFLLSLAEGEDGSVPVFVPAALVYRPVKWGRTRIQVAFGEPFDTSLWLKTGDERRQTTESRVGEIQERLQKLIDSII